MKGGSVVALCQQSRPKCDSSMVCDTRSPQVRGKRYSWTPHIPDHRDDVSCREWPHCLLEVIGVCVCGVVPVSKMCLVLSRRRVIPRSAVLDAESRSWVPRGDAVSCRRPRFPGPAPANPPSLRGNRYRLRIFRTSSSWKTGSLRRRFRRPRGWYVVQQAHPNWTLPLPCLFGRIGLTHRQLLPRRLELHWQIPLRFPHPLPPAVPSPGWSWPSASLYSSVAPR